MSIENNEKKEKLLQLLHEVIARDAKLREEYQAGEKFRFIRDRLHALLAKVQEELSSQKKEIKQDKKATTEEVLVYVHLFNAHGMTIQSWQKMLNPSVFYEYSVNRPIYAEKSHIDAFIRTKKNQFQHGYLTIAVKKEMVLIDQEGLEKDSIGQPLLRVKEGSLDVDRLITFTHNQVDYEITETGEWVKKRV